MMPPGAPPPSVSAIAPAPLMPLAPLGPLASGSSWTLARIASALVQRHARIHYCATQHRFLFSGEGEVLDLADVLELVWRQSAQLAQAQQLPIDAAVLALHHERFFTADRELRYVINRSVAERDARTASDAISLRQYRSFLFFPANLLYRMDLSRPEAALGFAEALSYAGTKLLHRRDARAEGSWDNIVHLRDTAGAIDALEHPHLARLLEEQLLHNLMAHRAIFRQPPCRGGDIFVRITDLPKDALAAYHASAASDEGELSSLIFERAFMSTALSSAAANMYSRRQKKYKLVIRALGAGSGGRHFDGSVEGVWSGEEEVVFPPGTAFRVTRIEEGVASDCTEDGVPRTYIFMQEVSAAATDAMVRGLLPRRRSDEPPPLFLHGVCRELPGMLRKAAADVTCTVGTQRLPVVVASSRPGWDATAIALAPSPGDLPRTAAELEQSGGGLFRIALRPSDRWLRWSELVEAFDLTPAEVAAVHETVARVGGDPETCWTSLEPVDRRCWKSLEVWRAEEGEWAEVELPPVLPHVAGSRQRRASAASGRRSPTPLEPVASSAATPLELGALSREVQGILERYKQPFEDSYRHPRTGERVVVRYSSFVEPWRREVPRWTHGAMHAARTTLWGMLLSELYHRYTGEEEPHLHDLLLAMTHHDCAREDEGGDLWDRQSGEQCAIYLEKRGETSAGYRRYFADAIEHKERRNTLARQLVQAADCLDIMRVSMFMGPLRIQRGWEPRGAFNSDQLDLYRVLGDAEGKESADELLRELHHFIRITEVPEVRIWVETRATEVLLELLGAVMVLHRRHGCYPQLQRWLAPFAAQLPTGGPTSVVTELLADYYERITGAVHPAAEPSAQLWRDLWEPTRWRTRQR
jgi:hypothetical protein